jgi:sugar transferase EpsL
VVSVRNSFGRPMQKCIAKCNKSIRIGNPPEAGLTVKRIFDLFAALALVIILSPLLFAIAVVVQMFLGSPVLFRQRRPGYKGRSFKCLKFRTMTDKRDANGHLLSDAERLTPPGRFLRSTSLDELPELINVIRGEMSLVGPRPLLMQYLVLYTPEQMRRHEVMPGITGWAQVNGRNAASWEQKFAYDVWYVKNRSFGLDLKILTITVWKTLTREGISQNGHVTMREFHPAPRVTRENSKRVHSPSRPQEKQS